MLMNHKAFDIKTPNKVRSLIAGFAMGNLRQFHKADGSGYEFLAQQIIKLNAINPQIASRLCTALTRFKRYDLERQNLMRQALQSIAQADYLSNDVAEVVARSLQ